MKFEFNRQKMKTTKLSVGLFLSQIADDWQFVHLSLVGLDQQNDPDNKESDTDHHPHQQRDQMSQDWNECQDRGDDHDANPKRNPAHREKDALKRMEPDKSILVVRFQH